MGCNVSLPTPNLASISEFKVAAPAPTITSASQPQGSGKHSLECMPTPYRDITEKHSLLLFLSSSSTIQSSKPASAPTLSPQLPSASNQVSPLQLLTFLQVLTSHQAQGSGLLTGLPASRPGPSKPPSREWPSHFAVLTRSLPPQKKVQATWQTLQGPPPLTLAHLSRFIFHPYSAPPHLPKVPSWLLPLNIMLFITSLPLLIPLSHLQTSHPSGTGSGATPSGNGLRAPELWGHGPALHFPPGSSVFLQAGCSTSPVTSSIPAHVAVLKKQPNGERNGRQKPVSGS